jgi:uncharacterized protein
MASTLVPMTFSKIMQTRGFTVIILGTDQKRFAIYTDPSVGKNIQNSLLKNSYPRPLTHELLDQILLGFAIKILQIVITNREDTVYFARIFFEQEHEDGHRSIIEIDARPSDCVTLGLMHKVPIFCEQSTFEKAVAFE